MRRRRLLCFRTLRRERGQLRAPARRLRERRLRRLRRRRPCVLQRECRADAVAVHRARYPVRHRNLLRLRTESRRPVLSGGGHRARDLPATGDHLFHCDAHLRGLRRSRRALLRRWELLGGRLLQRGNLRRGRRRLRHRHRACRHLRRGQVLRLRRARPGVLRDQLSGGARLPFGFLHSLRHARRCMLPRSDAVRAGYVLLVDGG